METKKRESSSGSSGQPQGHAAFPMGVLVLANRASSGWWEASECVLPYLDHLGVPYELVDLFSSPLPADLQRYPLIVLAHNQLDPFGARLGVAGISRLGDALRAGAGLASFDPSLTALLVERRAAGWAPRQGDSFQVTSADHFITARHSGGQVISFCAPLEFQGLASEALGDEGPGGSEVLARVGGSAFLSAGQLETGRWVSWASAGWMDPRVLGPLSGLDDLLWRGLAWAARKPFCFRGLPPLVTMRVDDVAGRGGLWGESPLYWVDDAIRVGLKPWLGLFIYNLTGAGVNQLRGQIQSGQVTAFPHAFGRPPREPGSTFPYYENALELRADTYDEFIYFDHQRGRSWPDAEAARGLAAADRWYEAHAPLPISRVALAHWYEMGANTCAHVHQRWGADLVGKVMDVDLPLADGTPWLVLGPFRRETPGAAYPFTEGNPGHRPVYYADFANFAGYRFFNSVTEIHDDAGYEWSPDNDVQATIARAARQISRAIDSMAMASLFTHETDFIYKIRPENWREIMAGIQRALAPYHPISLTLDDGMRYLRATQTARLRDARFDPALGEVTALLEGSSDLATHFYLFTDAEPEGRLVEIPVFEGRIEVRTLL
jgi:hypothetical protein